MEHNAATTVPIKLALSGSKRRSRLNVPLRFSQLCQHVRSTYPDVKDFNLQYVDEEGDTINVSSDEDLKEAHSVFNDLGRVLSFIVDTTSTASPPPPPAAKCAATSKSSTTNNPLAGGHGYGRWCQRRRHGRRYQGRGHGRWRQMARALQHPGFQCDLAKAMGSLGVGASATLHFGITCDGSNQHPLVGTRYHKIGHNYDLNGAEFAKLASDEQNKYEVIARPGAVPVPFTKELALPHPVLHYGVVCDGCNQNPLMGPRYHKIGCNYDLNETEFAKLMPDEQNKYEVIARPGAVPVPITKELTSPRLVLHFGVVCDGSNQTPVVGPRYHKIGHNYDLNEAEFSKLTPDKQKMYEIISRPGATPVPVSKAPDCVFVRDITVPDGQVVPAGKQFKKTWLVKTGATGWPAGCVLAHISGDKMGTNRSIALAPQKPHAFVEVSIDFTAPARPGKASSKWQVTGPDGKLFGHIVWATIVVGSLAANMTTVAVEPPMLRNYAAEPPITATAAAASTIAAETPRPITAAAASTIAAETPRVTAASCSSLAAVQQLIDLGCVFPIEAVAAINALFE